MKLEQAARQVVDAWDLGEFSTRMDEAITAMREALAEQAEQEPVATVVDESEEQTNTMSWILSLPLPVGTKLYAAPVRTKDLTDDEIADIRMSIVAYEPVEWGCVFARAVIAKFKEKNRG